MDLRGLRNDFIEIVARVIMFKDEQAKGVCIPNTDGWADLYYAARVDPGDATQAATIQYNRFTTEVDAVVAQLLNTTQTRETV